MSKSTSAARPCRSPWRSPIRETDVGHDGDGRNARDDVLDGGGEQDRRLSGSRSGSRRVRTQAGGEARIEIRSRDWLTDSRRVQVDLGRARHDAEREQRDHEREPPEDRGLPVLRAPALLRPASSSDAWLSPAVPTPGDVVHVGAVLDDTRLHPLGSLALREESLHARRGADAGRRGTCRSGASFWRFRALEAIRTWRPSSTG